jgi:hypothetical protein
MVTAAVPDEVSVTVCVVGVFRLTLPNATLVDPSVSPIDPPVSCRTAVFAAPLAVAVSVAVCVEVTAAIVAVNGAVVAPAATVTEAGTVTAVLLLARVTTSPPVGATALSVTVHASVPAAENDIVVQVSELSAPAVVSPVPLRLIVAVGFVVALLVIRTVPVSAPAVVGSNVTCSVALCPGFSVTGIAAPPRVKPVPVSVAALIVSAAVPDDVTVTDSLVDVLIVTSPKERLLVLRLIPAVCASSCSV